MRKSLAKVVNAIKNIGAATPTKEQTTKLNDAAAEIAKTAEENAAMHKGLLSAVQEVQSVVLSIYSGVRFYDSGIALCARFSRFIYL